MQREVNDGAGGGREGGMEGGRGVSQKQQQDVIVPRSSSFC